MTDLPKYVKIHTDFKTDLNEHIPTLYRLVVEKQAKIIVELGSGAGESGVALASGAFETKGKVYSYDLVRYEPNFSRFNNYGLSDYWQFTQADDLTIEWNQPIDHLFIDSSHDYEHTLKELAKFEPFVIHGGVITMHDIVSHPAVDAALIEYTKSRPDLTVERHLNCNGLAIITKE